MDLDLTERQRHCLDRATAFASGDLLHVAASIDHECRLPTSITQSLAQLGFLGVVIPSAHGGLGEGALTLAGVVERIASVCASTAALVSLQGNFIAGTLLRFGSTAQRDAFLPGVAKGESLGCWALSEPVAGDDVHAYSTRAESLPDAYVLTGEKSFVTLGAVAGFAIVFARISGQHELSAFLVPLSSPGITVGTAYATLGLRGLPVVTLRFEGVRVPRHNLVGAEGQGAAIIAHAVEGARIGVAAVATGLTQGALDVSAQVAKSTSLEGEALASKQEIQFKIAEMSMECDAGRALIWQAAIARDAGRPATAEAAMAKLVATEAAGKAATHALEIMGAKALLADCPVERMIRDGKNLDVCVGTPEALRLAIASAILKD